MVGTPERESRLLELVTTQRKLRNVDRGYWVAGSSADAVAARDHGSRAACRCAQ